MILMVKMVDLILRGKDRKLVALMVKRVGHLGK